MQKKAAEEAIRQLHENAEMCIQRKIELANTRQQQKDRILGCLEGAALGLADVLPEADAAGLEAFAAVQQHNKCQLQASLALSAAFKETQDAKAQLQQCLQKEHGLLESLQKPLRQGLSQSGQLVQAAAAAIQGENPAQELRHTEMLHRCPSLIAHLSIVPMIICNYGSAGLLETAQRLGFR